ncbi:hypothetical protein [Marinobacter caseinilyticus]|uniref:hypothetical protein n=1 Tax=Marinobacter caseinilyticus TaxID=2692195 RepID=UPI00140AABCE|nr:hypothetical protein [Marinobacter caseinilyticus]
MSLSNDYKPVRCATRTLLTQILTSQTVVEIVFKDESGQIQHYHDVIRDIFNRAGEEFILLGRGQLVRLDHVLVINGQAVGQSGVA